MLIELNIVNEVYLKSFNKQKLDLNEFRYVSLYKYLVNKDLTEINNIINMDIPNITLLALKNKRVKINEYIKLLENFFEKLKYKIVQQPLMITEDDTNNYFNTECNLSTKCRRHLLNEYILKKSLTNINITNLNTNGTYIPIKYILYKLQIDISYKSILSSTQYIYDIFNRYNEYADISNKLFENKYNKIEMSKNVEDIFKFLTNIKSNANISEEILSMDYNTQAKIVIDEYTKELSQNLLDIAIDYYNDLTTKYSINTSQLTKTDDINNTLYDLQYGISINLVDNKYIVDNKDIKKIKYLQVFTNNYEINYYDILKIYQYIYDIIQP